MQKTFGPGNKVWQEKALLQSYKQIFTSVVLNYFLNILAIIVIKYSGPQTSYISDFAPCEQRIFFQGVSTDFQTSQMHNESCDFFLSSSRLKAW